MSTLLTIRGTYGEEPERIKNNTHTLWQCNNILNIIRKLDRTPRS